MLYSISDSEDELNISPLRLLPPSAAPRTSSSSSSGDPATASTTAQLRAAAGELFHPHFSSDADGMMDGRKRRKTTAYDERVRESNMGSGRSLSSNAAETVQLARESVLFSAEPESQATVRWSTGEHERIVREAIGNANKTSEVVDAGMQDGSREGGVLEGIVTSAQLEGSSGSIPWSLESPVQLYEDAPRGKLRRPGSKQISSSSLQPSSRQPSSSSRQPSSASGQPSSSSRPLSSASRQPSSSASVAKSDSQSLQQDLNNPRPGRSQSAQVQDVDANWTLCDGGASKKRKRRTATEIGLFDESLSEELQRRAKEARRADSSGSKRVSTGSSVAHRNEGSGITSTESSVARRHESTGIASTRSSAACRDEPAGIATTASSAAHKATETSTEQSVEQSTDHELPTGTDGQSFTQIDVQAEDANAIPAVDTITSQVEDSSNATSAGTPTSLPPNKVVEVVIPRPAPPVAEFATPTAPASASRKTNKTKKSRSHTTIFEDHVGLRDRPDPSPNLHQQQATRKRGRGRPRKVRPEEPKPTVIEESAPDPTQGDAIVIRDEDEEDLLATKDHPPVAEPEIASPPVAEAADNVEVPAPIIEEPQISMGKENASWSSGKEMTPPPRDTSPRPMHSPIRKSVGGVSLRVGLSKRQRIQPLLRVCKR